MKTARPRKKPGRPPQPGGGARGVREVFLDAALELFGRRGVAATSVTEIAAAVGVSPAMAQYYFKNRELLLDALVSERLLPLIDSVWIGFDAALEEKKLLPLLRRLVERLLDISARNPWLPNLWISEILSRSGQLRGRIVPYIYKTYMRRFVEAFAAAQAQGLINPDLVPRLVVGSFVGGAMLPLLLLEAAENMEPDAAAREGAAQHALALLLPGLEPGWSKTLSGPRGHGDTHEAQ